MPDHSAADDARLLQANPSLAAYQTSSPNETRGVLTEIRRLRKLPADPDIALPQRDRTLGNQDPEKLKLIETLGANPVLREIYKKDAKATVKLIKIIQN